MAAKDELQNTMYIPQQYIGWNLLKRVNIFVKAASQSEYEPTIIREKEKRHITLCIIYE